MPLNVCSERDLLDYDIVFKSPGVSRYSPLIQQAIAAGVQVLSPNQLFFELNQSIKICITGSKGKSTFSKLIFELLEACDMKVILGGNIGVPLMNLVSEKSDLAVIELFTAKSDFSGTRSISGCLLYTSPSPRDKRQSRMPSSA